MSVRLVNARSALRHCHSGACEYDWVLRLVTNPESGIEQMAEDYNSVDLATDLTVAWLANPNTRTSVDGVPSFLRTMHDAVVSLGSGSAQIDAAGSGHGFTPAVSARKSLANKDHIISMIDGKPYKSLRRHLAGHGLTPEQYRDRYKLKADYPMVAANYSEHRRAMAKKIGLGRKPGAAAAQAEVVASPTKAPRPRSRSTKAKA